MKRNKHFEKWLLSISVITLIILVVIMIVKVSELQGDARVINYAGRARGATQRLIKQELSGYENDELINILDDILRELLTGVGEKNLKLIKDNNYLTKLEAQIELWKDLKEEIYSTRVDLSNSSELYILSEEYYELADNTVDAAEIYSAKNVSNIRILELIIIILSLIIVTLILLILYDIIYLARLNKKLNNIAYIDMLTGLPNRSYCEIKMSDYGIIHKDSKVACFMFDLNNLKITNDTLGHPVGDILITNLARILKESAPENMLIGRVGGDEFIGIIYDISEDEINIFISNFDENIKMHNENSENHGGVTISCAYGYALSSDYDEITMKGLLAQADKKMYEKKAQMKAKDTYID